MVNAPSLLELGRAGQALTDELVIDAHTHCGRFNIYYLPQSDAPGLVEHMDRLGIDRAVTFALEAVGSDFVIGNNVTLDLVRRRPDRFIGFATMHARYPEEMIPELERCAAAGLKGIKLIPAYQKYPETGENYFPVYEWADAQGWIVLNHSWGAPDFVREIARRYPRMCLLMGHISEVYAQVLRQCDNVYTTTTNCLRRQALARAVQAMGAEKILFGSDFPDLDGAFNLAPILYAQISDDDKRRILGLNMARLLREHAGVEV